MPSLKTVQIGTVLYKLPFADLVPMDPEDREALRVSIVAAGKVREPIVTWKEQSRFGEETVVDGANRVMICAEENLPNPPRRPQSFASEEEARKECEDLNYARRHLTREQVRAKRAARVERVAAARVEGQSLRAIAEEEGVSTTQVREDIKAATVQGCTVEPPDGQVVGKDKKKRKASMGPTLCERCQRIAPGKGIADCPACKLERDKAEKKKKVAAAAKRKKKAAEPRPDVKDQTGAIVPDSCRDAFADPGLGELVGEMEAVESMLSAERWIDHAQKFTPHYPFILVDKFRDHAWESLRQLQIALSDLKAGLPYAVCPKCGGVDSTANGKTCRTCRGSGHVPEWKHTELEADKAKV